MDNYQESPFNDEAVEIDNNFLRQENEVKEQNEGISSPQKHLAIKLIENKAVVYHQHGDWKLRRIKEVPLPQPSLKLNIKILPSKDLPSI
ncbi:MAG TPA: hypothetical protein V6D12_18860 [Candidatus Obscuribacterales bacterium]